jgi:amino acid transporter
VGFDKSLSGWKDFGFFIGLLPAAWTFSAIGMVSSMAEEVNDCTTELPKAMVWMVPVSFIAGLFYVSSKSRNGRIAFRPQIICLFDAQIIPICATLPPLENLLDAPYGQALPYVFVQVLGSRSFAAALSILVAILLFGACITMTTAASRTTWALARDQALPGSSIFNRINKRTDTPLNAALLAFTIEALLTLIYLGNASAFNAFVSVAVFGLAVAYIIPIIISVSHGRREVNGANWNVGHAAGLTVNFVAIAWVAFELVLFSMPTTIPTTPEFMNYAIVVFTGFLTISAVWYVVYARKGKYKAFRPLNAPHMLTSM